MGCGLLVCPCVTVVGVILSLELTGADAWAGVKGKSGAHLMGLLKNPSIFATPRNKSLQRKLEPILTL